MRIIDLQQGSPQWQEYRRAHFNASDAAAMLGISPYKSRDELLAEYATGLAPTFDAATLARFEEGHRLEAEARPHVERLIAEDLFPVVGEWDHAQQEGLPLSASFDGITMDGAIVWENKTENKTLLAAIKACRKDKTYQNSELPDYILAQLHQQLLVSGASQLVFTTYGDEGLHHIFIQRTLAEKWEARLIAGWRQFKKDLAEWKPAPPAPEVIGQTPESLPALSILAEGRIIRSNLADYIAGARAIVAGIKTTLVTDNDFADAEKTVKWAKTAEEAIETSKAALISQTADIGTALNQLDALKEELRGVRLKLDHAVKQEKEARKREMVDRALDAFREHIDRLQGEISGIFPGVLFSVPQPYFGDAIKGLRTISSIRNALDTALAGGKVAADARAREWRAKLAWFNEWAVNAGNLFYDLQALLEKPTEDFKAAVTLRIREEKEREAAAVKKAEEAAAVKKAEEAAAAKKAEEAAAAKKAEAAAAAAAGNPTETIETATPLPPMDTDAIRAFLNARGFGKEESRVRAILLEFIKFCRQQQTTAEKSA